MRDYKNVKVPRSYRGGSSRVYVKKAVTGRGTVRNVGRAAGIRSTLVNFAIIALVAAGSVFGWQAYQAVMRADAFQVSGVDIKGVKQLNEATLSELAAPFKGQNIFRVDLEAAVRRARANPWVQDVRVHRSLPNRITMVFVERTPVSILDTGSARYLMDDGGYVIERLMKEHTPDWPLPVIAIRDCRVRPGDQVASEGLSEAMELLREISARGGWQLANVTVKANSPDSISVVYADKEFKLGSGRYPEKLRRLAEVMNDVGQRGLEIAYVDLRPERQAAVMVKNNSSKYKVQSTESGKKRQEKPGRKRTK